MARQERSIGAKVSGRNNRVRISVEPERMTGIHSVHRHHTPVCEIHAPTTGENTVPEKLPSAKIGQKIVRCTGPKRSAVDAAWMASKMLPDKPARKRSAIWPA